MAAHGAEAAERALEGRGAAYYEYRCAAGSHQVHACVDGAWGRPVAEFSEESDALAFCALKNGEASLKDASWRNELDPIAERVCAAFASYGLQVPRELCEDVVGQALREVSGVQQPATKPLPGFGI